MVIAAMKLKDTYPWKKSYDKPSPLSPPGSSVHGISQARILKWVAIAFSRGSSWPSNWTKVSALQADSLPTEPPGKPMANLNSVLKNKKSRDITLPTKVHRVKTIVFPVVINCGAGEDSWESLVQIKPVNPKGNQSWIFIARIDAEAPILWPPGEKSWLIAKDTWCWERLKAGGEGDDRGCDGCMASSLQWTWIWVNSRRWWRMGKPGMLQSMRSQRVSLT